MNNGLFGIQGRAGVTSSSGGTTVPIGGVLDMAVGTNLPSTLTVDGQKFIKSGSTVQYNDELKSLVDLGIGSTLNQQLVGGFPQGGGTKALVYNTNTDLVEYWTWVQQSNTNNARLYGPDTTTNPTSFEVTLKAEFDIGGWACMWMGYSYGTKKAYCLAKGVSSGTWDGSQISYPVQLFSTADGFTWIKENFTTAGTTSNWFSGYTHLYCAVTDNYIVIGYRQTNYRYANIYNLSDFSISLSGGGDVNYSPYSLIPVKEGFIHTYLINGGTVYYNIAYYKGNATGDAIASYTLYNSTTGFYHYTPVVYAKGIFLCYEYIALGSSYVWKYTRSPVGAIATSPEWTAVTGGPTGTYSFLMTLEDNSYSKIYMSQASTTAYQSSDYGVTWSSYTPVTTAAFTINNQPMVTGVNLNQMPISRGIIGHQSLGYHLDYNMLSIDGTNASSPGFFQTILYLSGYYYGFTSGISATYDSGQVFRSTDLHDWKMVFSCPAKFVNAKILNGNLVGFHGTSRITYSSNGTSWTSGNLNGTAIPFFDGEYYNGAGTYKYVFVGSATSSVNTARLNSTTLALTGWTNTAYLGTSSSLRSITLGGSTTAFITADVSSGDSSGIYNFATDAFTASTTQLQYINYWNTSYPNRAVWCGNKWVTLVGTGTPFKMYYTTDGTTLTQVSQTYVVDLTHLEYDSTNNTLCGVTPSSTMRKWTSVSTSDFSVYTDTPLMTENNVFSYPIINFVNNKTLATQYIKSTYPGSALTVMDISGGSTYFTLPPIIDDANTTKYVRYK